MTTIHRSLVTILLLIICFYSFNNIINAQVVLPPQSNGGIYPWVLGYSIPPNTINVKLKNRYTDQWPPNTPDFLNVPLADYVVGVVMGELGASPTVEGWPFSASAWDDEAVKAMSIVARTFGSYNARRRSENGWSGIYNNDEDQVYRPYYDGMAASVKTRYTNLSNMYTDLYVAYNGNGTQKYKGNLVDALFKRDSSNPTVTVWNNGNPGYAFLPAVSNPYTTGTYTGQGLPQLPLQAWSVIQTGTANWWQLLAHYYPGSHILNKHLNWSSQTYNSYTGNDCSGTLLQTRSSLPWINFDWGQTSLGLTTSGAIDPTSSVPVDNVCIRFDGNSVFASGWYTFYIVADDGFQLLIDNQVVLSRWFDQSSTLYSVNVPMTSGTHQITLKYYDHLGGAVARLFWRRYNGMIGSYYDTVISKTGTPGLDQIVMQRPDPTIGFEWANSSPLDTYDNSPIRRIDGDSFSTIWESYLHIPSSQPCRVINFSTLYDDGLLVKLGAQTLLDRWSDHAPTSESFSTYTCPGTYLLHVRYYESGYGATISFTWN